MKGDKKYERIKPGRLQERLTEFGCVVLNYTDNKIIVDYFYSEERYKDYLSGINCRQGMGIHSISQSLNYKIIPDDVLVVVKKDGVHTEKYKYITLFKATLTYKCNETKKKSFTFSIRKNMFSDYFNFFVALKSDESKDFKDLNSIMEYIKNLYGEFTLKVHFSEGAGYAFESMIKTRKKGLRVKMPEGNI